MNYWVIVNEFMILKTVIFTKSTDIDTREYQSDFSIGVFSCAWMEEEHITTFIYVSSRINYLKMMNSFDGKTPINNLCFRWLEDKPVSQKIDRPINRDKYECSSKN